MAGVRIELMFHTGTRFLVFSFIGYKKQEVNVANRSIVNVSLDADAGALEEVVVVGYGTQKRSSLTGAVSTVTPKELTALPVPNVSSALQGRVPGVSVVNNGGPGSAPIVQIRGVGSINYASGPLYVIDGVPTGDLNSFNTNDIESLEVLKDASSAAIYGSRASNGVILITTKKGSRDNKVRITLDSYVGTQSAWHKVDVLNRDQYVQYAKALNIQRGHPPARPAERPEPAYLRRGHADLRPDRNELAERAFSQCAHCPAPAFAVGGQCRFPLLCLGQLFQAGRYYAGYRLSSGAPCG